MPKGIYHIGIRLRDHPRDYLKHLTCKLALEFGIGEYDASQIVPHVTLIRPFFSSGGEGQLISSFNEVLSKENPPIDFRIEGFGVFQNKPPVFYAQVDENPRLKGIIHNLEAALDRIIEYQSPRICMPGEDSGINLHVSVLSKGTEGVGEKVKQILEREQFLPLNQLISRVYLLKGKFILREYDFYLKRSLTRFEAIDPFVFLATKRAMQEA